MAHPYLALRPNRNVLVSHYVVAGSKNPLPLGMGSVNVRKLLFTELDECEKYDGIWACASILHLPKEELKSVFRKMLLAVKVGGYIYTSFKYGRFEGYRNERYFTDFTEDSFGDFISDITEIRIVEKWITSDVRPGRGYEQWLNLILKKSD
ncbi:MAG: class I SAM-dependent methyltransferase [Lachnospiraceae bacterium]|nr:class I SAM-dependent methyltransferase [Lachnospiraceae bacterium]